MKEKLLAFLGSNPRSTFTEVEGFFQREGFDYRGETSIDLRAGANIMLWAGWNHCATDLLLELVHSGEIVINAADWIERMCFGRVYDLPIAKKPDHDYKAQHWFPVVISAAKEAQR